VDGHSQKASKYRELVRVPMNRSRKVRREGSSYTILWTHKPPSEPRYEKFKAKRNFLVRQWVSGSEAGVRPPFAGKIFHDVFRVNFALVY
jgi:hypothetical protein